jgi:CBS domain containing-hemolysin-like protein
MNDDRSPDRATQSPGPPEGAREPWYERLLHLLHVKPRDSVRDELEDALAEAGADPTFSPYERAMLKNVLSFHRLRVDDIMVPRADIVAVSLDATLGDLLGLFRTEGHSRLPVYGETLDDPKGMVHIRDFLDYVAAHAEGGVSPQGGLAAPNLGGVDLSIPLARANVFRPVLFVPPSMPAIDLLVRMQATRTHMALVIDEYGGTDGLISIEDLVEAVVGDIEDEHDVHAALMIVRQEDGTYLADARASLEETTEALGVPVASEDMADDVDTVGGLIVTLAGRVPLRGELVTGPNGLEFEVLDADPRRVKRVRIHPAASPADGNDRAPAQARPAAVSDAASESGRPAA